MDDVLETTEFEPALLSMLLSNGGARRVVSEAAGTHGKEVISQIPGIMLVSLPSFSQSRLVPFLTLVPPALLVSQGHTLFFTRSA